MTVQFAFDNSYARLPERFYAPLPPTPVARPKLIRINTALAEQLGLDADWLASEEGVSVLSGNLVPDGAASVALAYAGHQFGHFNPQLGDGRAILLGEVVGRDGLRRDIQLKGAGPTPFSRRGDGRAALGPVLRDYLVSEAMAALGLPTTRALAAVTTGEEVVRETMLPGGVLTRVASSHIRVGTFQYFAAREDMEAVRLLADHAIARHYPEAAEAESPYLAFLGAVAERQATLIARWLSIGFIHGVMNTDNCSVAGETIDYGPCAFMDEYHPGTVFSSIDQNARYAYGNQPSIGLWNVSRLAETLLPLIDVDQAKALEAAKEVLGVYGPRFHAEYAGLLRRKIGLAEAREGDDDLAQDLLKLMMGNNADFTLTFRRLGEGDGSVAREQFMDPAAFDAWHRRWLERLAAETVPAEVRRAAMRGINPAFIPRNHLVEAALNAAIAHGDFGPFEEMLGVLSRPYDDRPGAERYMEPPLESERVRQTFCGT